MERTACTEHQYMYNGAPKLYLYFYSPYGPYSLYRASVPVQWCTLPLLITRILLWTVQTVQSLNTCTTVHFNFTCTSTTPMDSTECTEPQWLYKSCTLTLPILLHPLWTVRPVQSLSASTTVHFNFTYTSPPPMDRTACTGPQYLYNGAL